MMPTLRKSFLALGLTFALAACGRAAPLTEQEQHTVTELIANMKTRCVGRYLIDLPAEVQTSGSATLKGVQVSTEKITQQEFLKEMQQRETELRAMKHLNDYLFFYGDSEAYVNKSDASAIRQQGIWYFIHMGDIYKDPANRNIEVYKWDHGVRIKLEIEASDFTRPDQSDDSIVKQLPLEDRDDVGQKLSNALDLARNFRGRADDDIPTGPGVCIDGGFIAGAASDEERIAISFYLNRRRDVSIDFSSDSSYAEETTLLQRSSEINAAIKSRQGKTIREGVVKLNDIPQAEEWLAAALTISDIPGHRFRLEANSKIGSTKTPLLILEMVNGVFPSDIPKEERIKASLTEGEAVALWDAVSRTIRVRPGAMDAMPLPTVSATEHRLPLGTIVCSGQTCRQGGYYHTHWNGETYRKLLCPDRPAPTLNLMEPVPYRWLPGLVNRMLLKQDRLPMVLAEHVVNWELASYLL